MDTTVHRLLQYLEEFPLEAGASELKNQLSAFTHHDLRAACSRLNLSVPSRQNKKSGFIAVLVSYWKASQLASQIIPTPLKASKIAPSNPSGIELPHDVPHDVAQFVELFPPHGHVEELQNHLNACRSRTLRSACVLLGLQPRKTLTKKEFLGLLVHYWQDSFVVTSTGSQVEEPQREEMVDVVHTKRPRGEEGKHETKTPMKKKKNKVLEHQEDLVEEQTGVRTTSLEKAKVVKEWASAIEILARVDGSAESIESIRKLIDGVVHSATSEL